MAVRQHQVRHRDRDGVVIDGTSLRLDRDAIGTPALPSMSSTENPNLERRHACRVAIC